MKITQIDKGIKLISAASKEDYFEKQTYLVPTFGGGKKEIYLWFAPANNYPETIINAIRTGTTLESILYEDLIYKTGAGFMANDSTFQTYLDGAVNMNNETFKDIFKESNDHFNKLGNVFNELIFDENYQLVSNSVIQPQKVRITKDGYVWLFNDWSKFKKDKAVKMPVYPRVKRFTASGVRYYKSIYHIKNKVLGFDHYGINDKMIEAILLNEKEHRRNNWQLNQIKRGFKRDFFLVSEFPLTEKEKKKADESFAKSSGDDYAGGIETVEGENAKLVPSQSNYDFDYTKDDTSDQLFLKMGFPRSLLGIKSGAAFSVEQVESDYDQYLPKVEEQQTFILSKYKKIYDEHTSFNTDGWNVINTPPSVILQNYMQYMNDEQKSKVIDNLFTRYGI